LNRCKLFECVDYRYILNQCTFMDSIDCIFDGDERGNLQNECLNSNCEPSSDCDASSASMIEQTTAAVRVNITFVGLPIGALTDTSLGSISTGLAKTLMSLNVSNDDVSVTHVNSISIDLLLCPEDRRRRLAADNETEISFVIAAKVYDVKSNLLVDPVVAQAEMDAVLEMIEDAAVDSSLMDRIKTVNALAEINSLIASMLVKDNSVAGTTAFIDAMVMSQSYEAVFDPEKYVEDFEGDPAVDKATTAAIGAALGAAVGAAVADSVAGSVGGSVAGSAGGAGGGGG